MAIESKGILSDVKKLVNIEDDDDSFDLDIMIHINSTLATLHQLGVIKDPNFAIDSGEETWDQLVLANAGLSNVKSYIFIRVRLLFDPPTNPTLLTSLKEQRLELEWRMNVTAEHTPTPV